jgi:hypothetical protein
VLHVNHPEHGLDPHPDHANGFEKTASHQGQVLKIFFAAASRRKICGQLRTVKYSMLQLLQTTRTVTPDGEWCLPWDSANRYAQHCHTQGADWFWRHRALRYTVNSQGYRAPEFDTIPWADSVAFFGCSTVFGEAVSDEHTVASLVPGGVNLGRSGVDATFQWINTVRLRDAGIRPRACVYMWPSASRVTQFRSRHQVKQWGAWNTLTPGDWAAAWLRDPVHKFEIVRACYHTVDHMWHDQCPVVHMSYGQEIVDILPTCHLITQVDHGRDLAHPGVETNQNLADLVRKRLGL